MLKRESEELLEKRLNSWYFATKGQSGSAYAASLRRWLTQTTDETYSLYKADLGISKAYSRIVLYEKLNSLCDMFTGIDIVVEDQTFEKMIWDFQVYSIFDLHTSAPYGVFLAVEKELSQADVDRIQGITGLLVEKIQDMIYQLK